MGQSENSVMYAVEQVCSLYGVQVTREQSRQFNVQGSAGRWRPMFFGSWTDTSGKITRRVGKRITSSFNKGKADFLARPRIACYVDTANVICGRGFMSVPLWIECKSLKGRQTPDQAAFETWVKSNGDEYLLLREDVRPLIAWFDAHGVTKQCDDAALVNVVSPVAAEMLDNFACKWCGFARKQHKGKIMACPLELAQCNTKLIGKVWSPDLRRGIPQPLNGAGSETL